METKTVRAKLERFKGAKESVMKNISSTGKELAEVRKSLKYHEQAKEVIKQVGLATQQQLQYHISDITTLALESIFDNAYKLEAEFVERRDKTECDLMFVRDGEYLDPITASGGGAVDVASFALRIASWSMEYPRLRNVIILDEPMRFLSEDLQEKASKMIKELSDKLGIQFLLITHEQELTTYADKVFEVRIKKGISKVIEKQ
jgi:DNA repair exonuclease SbcCD ATPase subunit